MRPSRFMMKIQRSQQDACPNWMNVRIVKHLAGGNEKVFFVMTSIRVPEDPVRGEHYRDQHHLSARIRRTKINCPQEVVSPQRRRKRRKGKRQPDSAAPAVLCPIEKEPEWGLSSVRTAFFLVRSRTLEAPCQRGSKRQSEHEGEIGVAKGWKHGVMTRRCDKWPC